VGEEEVSEGIVWRRLYAEKNPPGRETVFVKGTARGDYYQATGDVWRVRWWSLYRLQGGDEQLVIGEQNARQKLEDLANRAIAAEGEAA
jgi:hypothetical protein